MRINFSTRTIFTLLFLFVLTACGGKTADEYISQAKQFIGESKYDSATIELKNALQENSQSAQARWLLGKVYLDTGDVLSAEKEIQRAERLGWTHDDVVPALAVIFLAQGKYEEVDKLDSTGLQKSAAASFMAHRAMAAMARGENRKAKKLIERSLASVPDSPDALLAQARILASQGDLPGASEVLDALLAQDPNNAIAWDLVGDLRMGQQQMDEAVTAYGKAIAARKNNFSSLFKRSLLYLREGKYEQAQADATELLRISPQHPRANYVQGLIHFQAAKYPEAITSLSVAETAADQFPLTLFFLASAQLIEGHLDLATVQAVRFNTMVPESIRGRKLLATIRLQEGKFGDVQELLRPVLDMNPDDIGALNLMANALLRDEKIDEGISLLAHVAELQPDSPVAQVRLGAGLLLGGNSDDAAQHMESALQLAPEFQQADILLVMNHLQKRDFEGAIEAAQAYRKRHLTSVTPYNLLGRVYLEAGQQGKAKESFEKALSLEPGDPAASHNLAQMAIADGELATAREYYESILAQRENYLPALIQLALLDAREENGEALVAHLEQAMEAHPTNLQPRLLMGRYQLSQGRPEKVAPLFSNLSDVQQKSPQVLQLVALAQLSENESEKAQYTLEQLMESVPDTAPLHHMLAKAAAGTGDVKKAEEELRKAIALDETYLPSRIALARLLLAEGHREEFEKHIALLQSQSPENPDVLLLRADAAFRNGNSKEAVELAEQAYKKLPNRAVLLALAAYKNQDGDSAGAMSLYQSWLKDQPNDIVIMLVMSDSYTKAGQIDEAVALYERVIKLEPDNVAALNNIAWHIRQENPVLALTYIRRASTLAPDSADVLDTQAVVEYANKEYVPARRSIDRALDKRPGDLTLAYHRAMIAAAAGDTQFARSALEKLLEGDSQFPERAEAKALLEKLE